MQAMGGMKEALTSHFSFADFVNFTHNINLLGKIIIIYFNAKIVTYLRLYKCTKTGKFYPSFLTIKLHGGDEDDLTYVV